MTNLTVFNKMINQYNRLSFTHNYIFGFADRGTIYAVVTNSDVLPLVCCLDASSRNGVSLKAKLLREGAYYWYQDNSNMVDFENVSVTDTSLKKTYKINYKKPNPDETLIVEYKNKVRT